MTAAAVSRPLFSMIRFQKLRIFSALALALGIPAFLFSGCITHRTVTQNGRVISKGPAIKRPLRDAIHHSRH
jgi:hypothetical protein